MTVMGSEFNDVSVQIDGHSSVVDTPDGADAFVAYFRSISSEHDDWDEYGQAMEDQGKCMILDEPHWTPLIKHGFPPELFGD